MSTLADFMQQRTKQVDQGFFKPIPPRMVDGKLKPSLDEMCAAARKAADRDRSDPFVFGRAMNLLRQGIYHPTDLNEAVSI